MTRSPAKASSLLRSLKWQDACPRTALTTATLSVLILLGTGAISFALSSPMSDFAVNGALFGQSAEDMKKRMGDRYDPSKNYPQYDGVVNIPADAAYALAEYIMNGKPIGDRNEIPLAISGWKKTAASGKTYLSLSFKPHYKYEKSDNTKVADSAASLAEATNGEVVDDFPF